MLHYWKKKMSETKEKDSFTGKNNHFNLWNNSVEERKYIRLQSKAKEKLNSDFFFFFKFQVRSRVTEILMNINCI